jgi:hypothetical protein
MRFTKGLVVRTPKGWRCLKVPAPQANNVAARHRPPSVPLRAGLRRDGPKEEDSQRPSKTVKDSQSFCGRCRVGRAGRGQKIEDEDEHEDESRLIKGKAPSSNSQRNFKHQPPMQELKNLPDAQVAGHALRIGTIRAPGQNRGRGRGRGGLKANQG